MNRRSAIAAGVLALCGLVSGVGQAAFFAACTPQWATASVLSTNSPRKFTTTVDTNCNTGDANTCCWIEHVAILRQRIDGIWVLVSSTDTTRSNQPCNGTTEQVKDYPVGSAGTFQLVIDVQNCDKSTTFAHTALTHTFP